MKLCREPVSNRKFIQLILCIFKLGLFKFLEASDRTTIRPFEMPSLNFSTKRLFKGFTKHLIMMLLFKIKRQVLKCFACLLPCLHGLIGIQTTQALFHTYLHSAEIAQFSPDFKLLCNSFSGMAAAN